MQKDASESHSVVTDVNSLNSALATLGYSDSVYRLNHNHVMSGFPQPVSFVEAVNNLVCGQIVNRDEIWNLNIQDPNQVMEGIPFPTVAPVTALSSARNVTLDNQEKLPNFGHCVYPFDDSSNVVYSSFEAMNHGYETLPFDSSTKWDLNKFVTPESVGRVIGRNGVQPLNQNENSFPNEWILSQNTAGTNSNSRGTSRFSNELSLSLASSQPSTVHGTSIQDQCSEQTSCSSNNLSLSFDSYKPLQPSPLLGSRLFQAMQEILAEIACYALVSYSTTGIDNGNNIPVLSSHCIFPSDKLEVEAKKKHMLALLQMIDEQYNRCMDEVHTVVSAFHAVTELDPNLHARFALPTISSMYKNLRARISCHILAMGTNLNEGGDQEKEEKSFETSFIQKQWALQQLRKSDSQLWRPQRGLPERSVSVLRAWMFQNFLHPYPKDAEKHLLAIKSGLTRNQVSNWFINARVRLWKPMIEEMYAEMSRRKARRNGEEQTDHGNFHINQLHFENIRFAMD
ncbi:homeobox protein ATH1-like [Primulina huaijiensis]|uniref:homeobox protein ATH1-like n=1 Tax=Primulina huaijiensis TaxID=1492673 RepID=UPI003CC73838